MAGQETTRFFTLVKGSLIPIDIRAVTRRTDDCSFEGGLSSCVRQAITSEPNGIKAEEFVLAGKFSALPEGYIREGLEKFQASYDQDVIFVVGNPDLDSISFQYPEYVFPLVPFRRKTRELGTEFAEVNRPLFRYNGNGKVVYDPSTLAHKFFDEPEMPVTIIVDGQEIQLSAGSPQSTKRATIQPKHIEELCPKQWNPTFSDYLKQIIPVLKSRVDISSDELVLLAVPKSVYLNRQYGMKTLPEGIEACAIAYATSLLNFGIRSLPKDRSKKPGEQQFPLEKIIRVIGAERRDFEPYACTMAMFGHKPKK